jgi:hypothetical protein
MAIAVYSIAIGQLPAILHELISNYFLMLAGSQPRSIMQLELDTSAEAGDELPRLLSWRRLRPHDRRPGLRLKRLRTQVKHLAASAD